MTASNNSTEDIETYFTSMDEVVCPHCGTNQSMDDSEPEYYTENPVKHQCRECGGSYTLYGSMSWSWETSIDG